MDLEKTKNITSGLLYAPVSSVTFLAKGLTNGMSSMVSFSKGNIVSPLVSVRPMEVLVDSIEYTLPYVSQNNACVHLLKRAIRRSVFDGDKDKGTISFSVKPNDAWLLDMSRVDVEIVLDEINKWLKDANHNNDFPRKVTWTPREPLKSKVNHGEQFVVHYFWSDKFITLPNDW